MSLFAQKHHNCPTCRCTAALEPARAPDLSDPVVVHLNMLRGTIAKPTVEQIIHLYGREAFRPMIDAAVAKALEDACLAVSEHADWPEDEHGRTEQVGLFARVINAILAALSSTDAAHVNETPKSEHDGADVLTAAQARDAMETCGKCMGSGYGGHPDSGVLCPDCNGSGGIRADLAAPDLAELVEAAEGLSAILDKNETKGPLPDTALMFCWLAAQNVRAVLRGYMSEKPE